MNSSAYRAVAACATVVAVALVVSASASRNGRLGHPGSAPIPSARLPSFPAWASGTSFPAWDYGTSFPAWASGTSFPAWASGTSFPAWASGTSSRPLLPLLPPSAAALALSFLICILAAAAGIGGGAALVPLYLTLAGQDEHAAVALSNATILGSAAAAFALNSRRWLVRPDAPPTPLIDWDVILLMEPATIVGAIAGALLNAIAPPAATLVGLGLLLVLTTSSVGAKARGAWRAETAALETAAAAAAGSAGVEAGGGSSSSSLADPLLLSSGGGESEGGDARPPKPLAAALASASAAAGAAGASSPKPPATLPPPPPSEACTPFPIPSTPPRLPLAKVGALTALFCAVLAADALKTRFPCGSRLYWLATVSVVPPALALTGWARSRILAGAAAAAAAEAAVALPGGGEGEQDDDHAAAASQVAWTPANTLLIPAVSSVAGVAAGAFGVGGGIIKGPFLLIVARLPPAVASATAITMILFTSATASLQYLSAGAASPDWIGAVFAVGLVGSAVGVVGLARAIRSTGGRQSLVSIAMAVTLGLSLVAVAWQAWLAVSAGEVVRGSLCK